MQAFIKSAAVALAFLGASAPSLAIDVLPPGKSHPPAADIERGRQSGNPLDATGGSSFDPRSLTGGVTLTRLLGGAMGPEKRPLSTADQVAIWKALAKSGVHFSYQLFSGRWVQQACFIERSLGDKSAAIRGEIAPAGLDGCPIVTLPGEPLGEPVWLQGVPVNTDRMKRSFMIARPAASQWRSAASSDDLRCVVNDKLSSEAPIAADLSAKLEKFPIGEAKSGESILLRVTAHFNRAAIKQALDGGKDDAAAARAMMMNRCASVEVWTYEVSPRGGWTQSPGGNLPGTVQPISRPELQY